MPFYLVPDELADDPSWEVLAGGRPALVDALQASWARLMARASHSRHDGYLTAGQALQTASSRRVLDLLLKPVVGLPPKLHRRGDECECLGDVWVDGFEYRLHGFLRRNPSRREKERNEKQKADLRDTRLKQFVFDRDGGRCRYCRSGRLSSKAGRARDRRKFLQFDHVDPDAPAGRDGENFVTACARCNEYKGHRTPEEADLILLPPPTEAERIAWLASEAVVLHDPADHLPINDETATDHRSTTDPDRDPAVDPTNGPDGGPEPSTDDSNTGDVCREQGGHDHQQLPDTDAKGPGWVRGGQPTVAHGARASPPDLPPRAPDAPDIYTRRSR